ncbi:TPR-like protein [Sistotremastrum suecicum HHB10207 ss-3]|uniref:TPR-like protein n=1 Tax=Sistotremastrum suecicum HHB10207 ss-3 TaxID=1314776 RepID=A0A165ZXS0_9AGAM|nr:TPR-like protein [Sistotremastrum suecicum HHB10207 ss-3]
MSDFEPDEQEWDDTDDSGSEIEESGSLEDEDFYSGSDSESGASDEEIGPEGANEDTAEVEDVNAQAVEKEIDEDFARLVGNIREGNDLSAGGMLNKSWDIPILDDTNANFHDEIRAASGIGKVRGKKGRGRRPHNQPALSPEVKSLIGTGSKAFVDQRIDEAIQTMKEVIRVEPRASAAWSVLIACYREKGQMDAVIQLGIMSAHLDGDWEQWYKLGEQSRERGYIQQAMYCYRKATQIDPDNVQAYWERASLAKEMGDPRTVKSSYLGILRRYPHDMNVLMELHPVLVESSDLQLVAELYSAALSHHQTVHPAGPPASVESGSTASEAPFTEIHLYVLADTYNALGDCDKAINSIRSGVRWLQGRADQKFWDALPDDREYDIPGIEREPGSHGIEPAHNPLHVNARHRLAISRLKLSEFAEAKIHCDIILNQSLQEYWPLFQEIADAYFEKEQFDLALKIYENLASETQSSGLHVLMQTAACRRHQGDMPGSIEVYQHVISNWPEDSDAKMKLAEIYEIINEPRKALNLVSQVIDARKRRSAKGNESSVAAATNRHVANSLFDETVAASGKGKGSKNTTKLSASELKELERKRQENIDAWYKRVLELMEAAIRGEAEAESEWISAFRGLKPSGKAAKSRKEEESNQDDLASRLQLELEVDANRRNRLMLIDDGKIKIFRGISIDDWLMLMIQYAFIRTRRNFYGIAQEVLKHVRLSIAFQDINYQTTLRLSLIACAMYHRDSDTIREQCRALINTYQFNNEPLRLLLVSLGGGFLSTEAFINTRLQKHLIRELRTAEEVVKGKDAKWNAISGRWVVQSGSGTRDDAEEGLEEPVVAAEKSRDKAPLPKPTQGNPIHMGVYGMLCSCAKSYSSALFYLLQAYDYHNDDPVICLAVGVACLGRAMQRQADNRNYMITQGFAFLSRYRKLRGGQDEDVDEVDYNFGRAFQQLGLHGYAVKHYEKVLNATEKRMKEGSTDLGLAREAAYNLSLILVTTGATELADELYRRWLSI